MSVGETLRNRRRQRNLSLEYAAQQTRIPLKFLKALEEEKWDVFSARAYLEGFLRRYAGFLALEGEELVRKYRGTPEPAESKPGGSPAPREDRRGPSDIPSPLRTELVFLLGVLALLFGLYVYRAKPFSQGLLPSRHATAPRSTHASSDVESHHQLRLRSKANVWVRVWTDDHIRFEGTLRPGVEKTWQAQDGFRVESSDLSALDLSVDDDMLPAAEEGRGEIVWPFPEGMNPEPAVPAAPVAAPRSPALIRTAPRPAPVARPLPAGTTVQRIRPAPLQPPPVTERSAPLAPPADAEQPVPPHAR